MSQYDMAIAGTNSGTELVAALGSWEAALLSCHSGSTRPSYSVAKTIWVNDATIPWVVNMYDGASDVSIGTVNPTTGAFTPSITTTPTIVKTDSQLQTAVAFTTAGSSTAYTLTPSPAIATNAANTMFFVSFHTSPGTNPTLSVSGQTPLNLKYRDVNGTKESVTSSQAITGWSGRVICDGTDWVLLDIIKPFNCTLSTAVAATTGAAIDFSIPTTARRVTINFVGVSTGGTSNPLIQIGSGSVTTTGYLGASSQISSAVTTANYTTGFGLLYGSAASVIHGSVVLSLENSASNTWVANGITSKSDAAISAITSGSVSLAGAIDRVRITTVGGTDVFDLGEINVSWEI